MPTVLQLAELGELIKLDPGLSWREQEDRVWYATPRVIKWLEEKLSLLESDWKIEVSPLEQFDTLLGNYCSGKVLIYDRQIKPIRHISNGIWELKTADLRVFGWFPSQDCFISTAIDLKSRIKDHGLVPGYRDEAVFIRTNLALDEPKFIPGDNPNHVISSCSFPPS